MDYNHRTTEAVQKIILLRQQLSGMTLVFLVLPQFRKTKQKGLSSAKTFVSKSQINVSYQDPGQKVTYEKRCEKQKGTYVEVLLK
jgi:hypothetical protein